jgi:polysaccharide pyruvyl transferase WcaK-like protein
MSCLKEFDLVVSTRLHLAILALCAGVPCAAIDYESKAREVFRRLGVERWVIDYEDIDPASLRTTVEEVVRSGDGTLEDIQRHLMGERSRLDELTERLSAMQREKSGSS